MDLVKIIQLKKKQVDQVRAMLALIKWSKRQIDGQIEGLEKMLCDKMGTVIFATEHDEIIGYIAAQFYSWNQLGQVHGLVVHPDYRKQGVASSLLLEVEKFMHVHHARGIYVDTPVNNLGGCAFYEQRGFKKAYVMPEYYEPGLDGVTFLKFFR